MPVIILRRDFMGEKGIWERERRGREKGGSSIWEEIGKKYRGSGI